MGLDITAYCCLQPTSEPEPDAYLSGNAADFAARADGLAEGPYAAARKIAFRAGSYSGYNAWRDQLAKLAGYPAVWHKAPWEKAGEESHAAGAWQATEGPFWELINFSDCEGYIGPKTSAKLARDFAEFQPKADALEDQWFRDCYARWREAFEMASNGGAVDFH